MSARSSKEHQAKTEAFSWVSSADEAYITARFLFIKGISGPALWIGALALELYGKAYLVKMKGSFKFSHGLTRLFQECSHYDKFFLQFLDEGNWDRMWPLYWGFLRYPERREQWKPFLWYPGVGKGTSIDTLDTISHFMRQEIPIPKGTIDPIDNLLQGVERPFWLWSQYYQEANSEEIREVFFKDNRLFTI